MRIRSDSPEMKINSRNSTLMHDILGENELQLWGTQWAPPIIPLLTEPLPWQRWMEGKNTCAHSVSVLCKGIYNTQKQLGAKISLFCGLKSGFPERTKNMMSVSWVILSPDDLCNEVLLWCYAGQEAVSETKSWVPAPCLWTPCDFGRRIWPASKEQFNIL